MKKTIFSILLSIFLLSASAAAEEPGNIQAPKRKGLIERGYKGNISIGIDFPIGELDHSPYFIEIIPSHAYQISTSHGYQFNPYFWLGGGIGISYGSRPNPGSCIIRSNSTQFIFAQVRGTPGNCRISPILDAKIGGVRYSIGDLAAFMASPSIGIRFGFRKCALNLLTNYNYQLLIPTDDETALNHLHSMGVKLEIEW